MPAFCNHTEATCIERTKFWLVGNGTGANYSIAYALLQSACQDVSPSFESQFYEPTELIKGALALSIAYYLVFGFYVLAMWGWIGSYDGLKARGVFGRAAGRRQRVCGSVSKWMRSLTG